MNRLNPRNPKRAVDFVDIVDIFRKASKHAGLLNRRRVDILWMSTRPWIHPWMWSFFAGVLDRGHIV